MKTKAIIGCLAIGVNVLCSSVLAAEREPLRNNLVRVSSLLDNINAFAKQIDQDLPQLLGLSDRSTLSEINRHDDINGDIITRYHQRFDDLPVIGAHIIISRNGDGVFMKASGAALYGIDRDIVDTDPEITENEALSIAKIHASKNIDNADYNNEEIFLAIWLDEYKKAKFIYSVSFFNKSESPSKPVYFIDAKSGEILNYFDDLQKYDALGPGGNQKTGVYYYGTDFGSLDVTKSGEMCYLINDKVKTIDLNHAEFFDSESEAFGFQCSENTYKEINGAFSPLNDAHFFSNIVVDMYNDWFNIDPLPHKIEVKVHYKNMHANAYWNGQSTLYGDGSNRSYPFTTLDIVSHEIAHGFTDQYSDLIYGNHPQGALNEAFSDMAGIAAIYYFTGESVWKIGLTLYKGDRVLRHFDEPELDGISISHVSDFSSEMDNHYSSGVYNHAFYNLANTQGWNTRKAFEVYARANMLYWYPYSDWIDAGEGVLDAACDLGYDIDAVKASLSDVGIHVVLRTGSSCNNSANMPWLVPITDYILM